MGCMEQELNTYVTRRMHCHIMFSNIFSIQVEKGTTDIEQPVDVVVEEEIL